MKSRTTSIIATLRVVIGLAVVPACAQPGGVQAKVPVNFVVLGKTFHQYTMIPAPHQLRIEDGKARSSRWC